MGGWVGGRASGDVSAARPELEYGEGREVCVVARALRAIGRGVACAGAGRARGAGERRLRVRRVSRHGRSRIGRVESARETASLVRVRRHGDATHHVTAMWGTGGKRDGAGRVGSVSTHFLKTLSLVAG